MNRHRVYIPQEELADFCRHHKIRRLLFFGSILRDDFRYISEIHHLVEMVPDVSVGVKFYTMELALSELSCREIDRNTLGSVFGYIGYDVLDSAEVQCDFA